MLGPGMIQQMQARCSNCQGSGKAVPDSDICKKCSGDGLIKERKEFEVMIERGMKDGQKITYPGDAGYSDPDSPPGDLIFIVDAKEHETFKRIHSDLVLQKKITLAQAMCGGVISVEQMDGRILKINPPGGNVIQPASWHSIEDEGMPIHGRPHLSGNLYIRFDVELPRSLTEPHRQQLMHMLGEPSMPMDPDDAEIEEKEMEAIDDIESELKERAQYDKQYSGGNAFDSDSDDDLAGRRVQCAHQ